MLKLLAGSGSPLQLILITDVSSLPAIAQFFLNFVGEHLSSAVIQSGRKVFPHLVHTFVDIEQIIAVDRPFFAALKNTSGRSGEAKYAADLFYIGPLYHLAFTNLTRMAVIDRYPLHSVFDEQPNNSTDLEFFDDIGQLFNQFELMSSQAVLAVGRDLSPHYRSLLSKFVLIKKQHLLLHAFSPFQSVVS